jgi:hypothetical protein
MPPFDAHFDVLRAEATLALRHDHDAALAGADDRFGRNEQHFFAPSGDE